MKRRIILILLASLSMLAMASPAQAHMPKVCSIKQKPQKELACGRADLYVARSELTWLKKNPQNGNVVSRTVMYVNHVWLKHYARSYINNALARIPRPTNVFSASTGGGWSNAQATWYGPGFYGHGPACDGNGVLTESSWWVATVPKQCGQMYTICDGSRCVHVPSEDTGGFARGNFDLAPAVARVLGGLYTHSVKYRLG